MMEEDALLQRGQRVDVLDVGCASRNHGHDPVDLLCAELYQRQHLRNDLCGGTPPIIVLNSIHEIEQCIFMNAQCIYEGAIERFCRPAQHQFASVLSNLKCPLANFCQ